MAERDGVSVDATGIGPGTRLGPYDIEGRLGAGGMGQVFRARDTRLGRTVAIKVSLKQFSGRFEREARAIAAINHSHICTLYDVGPNYLVMEIVEGETLAEALKRGPLPVDQALRYAAQIADALAAAHSQGIVHRDLKPGNVMIGQAGVKVLDFGLAKHAVDAGEHTETVALTAAHARTEAGQMIGTIAYMSPEQAEGKPIDVRSDVFAFGVVLYQMLSGRRPFQGESTLSTLASILQATPEPLRHHRERIPEGVEQIVRRCLEKKPEARYQSASEIQHALAAFDASSKTATFAVPRVALIAAALLALVAAGAYGWRSYQRASRVRWVEETAVPQIARLIQENRGLAALKLFRQAERTPPRRARCSGSPKESWRARWRLNQRRLEHESTFPTTRKAPVTMWRSGSCWVRPRSKSTRLQNGATTGFGPRRRALPRPNSVVGDAAVVRLTLQPEKAVPPGMVWVPPTAATSTAPPLALPAFWMDRFEVTNRQFKEFVDGGGYRKPEYWKQPFVKGGQIFPWQQAIAEFRDLTGRPGPATWQLGAYPEAPKICRSAASAGMRRRRTPSLRARACRPSTNGTRPPVLAATPTCSS